MCEGGIAPRYPPQYLSDGITSPVTIYTIWQRELIRLTSQQYIFGLAASVWQSQVRILTGQVLTSLREELCSTLHTQSGITSQLSMQTLCGKSSRVGSMRLLKPTQGRLESFSSLKKVTRFIKSPKRRRLWSASGKTLALCAFRGLKLYSFEPLKNYSTFCST